MAGLGSGRVGEGSGRRSEGAMSDVVCAVAVLLLAVAVERAAKPSIGRGARVVASDGGGGSGRVGADTGG